MGRLWTDNCGLQTNTAGIIWTAIVTTAPSIDTSIKRGTSPASYRINNSGALEGFRQAFTSSQGDYYSRTYLQFNAWPTGSDRIILGFGLNGSYKACLRVHTNGTVNFFNAEDNAQIGSSSSALSLSTKYRVEMKSDSTTLSSTAVEVRLYTDAEPPVLVWSESGTIDITATPTNFRWAITQADATLDYSVMDLAINDTSGSVQNSWPGPENIFCLRPNGNGANSDWGGSDGNSTDNYLLVNEIPPDSANYVQDDTSGQIDDYNLDATPAAMNSGDIVNYVQVGVYGGVSDATGGDPDIVTRATLGGNTSESGNLDCNSTTFHGPAPLPANDNYQHTLYTLPVSGSPITKSDLDSMQAGVRVSVTDTHLARVAALWVMVGFSPASGTAVKDMIGGFIPFAR